MSPEEFSKIQRVVQAIAGWRLHPQHSAEDLLIAVEVELNAICVESRS